MALILRGWVLTEEGKVDEGLAEILTGINAQVATGAELAKPYWLCLAAQASHRAGDAQSGLAFLAQAERVVAMTGERYWEAEVHRLRGELLLAMDSADRSAVEEAYMRAMEIAKSQGAISLELRAAMGLASSKRHAEPISSGLAVVNELLTKFSEGHATTDLRNASRLLSELGDIPSALQSKVLHGAN